MDRFQSRLIAHRLNIKSYRDQIKRLYRESKREQRPLPRSALNEIESQIRLEQGNINQIEAAASAFQECPPQ